MVYIFWWMVGCLFVLGLTVFETIFQFISGRLPKKRRMRREKIDESKNVQTAPTPTHCKRSSPLSYYQPIRTPRHWKFTQHHRTTQPPPILMEYLSNKICPFVTKCILGFGKNNNIALMYTFMMKFEYMH